MTYQTIKAVAVMELIRQLLEHSIRFILHTLAKSGYYQLNKDKQAHPNYGYKSSPLKNKPSINVVRWLRIISNVNLKPENFIKSQ